MAEHGAGEGTTLARLRALSGWRELRAVRHGHVYDVDGDLLLRAGPRLLDGLEAVAKVVQVRPGEDASV